MGQNATFRAAVAAELAGVTLPASPVATITQTYATAQTTVPAVTAATPGAATAVATGLGTAVTATDGTTPGAAALKADVDTRLTTLSTFATAALVDIASLRTQLTAANADILANRKLINQLVDALQAAGILA